MRAANVLLAVTLQHCAAGGGELRADAFQAAQDDEFVFVHDGAAMPHDVAPAGILFLIGTGICERGGR